MRLAKDFKKIAWNALEKSYWIALLAALVTAALGSVFLTAPATGILSGVVLGRNMAYNQQLLTINALPIVITLIVFLVLIAVLAIIQLLAGSPAEIGLCRYNLENFDQKPARFSSAFKGFDIFAKALGLRAWQTLLISLWFLLLVFPGFIAMYRYAMAPYIMADNPSVGVREAVRLSKKMMHGNKRRLFCLHLSFSGWIALCLLTFGIGFVFLAPYLNAASAAFYLEVSGQSYRLAKFENK